MLRSIKNFINNVLFPQIAWLPRYYILFKWGHFKKTDRVLDAGCGEGFVALKLARLCQEVTGVDLSASKIKASEESRVRSRVGNKVKFINGDILALPFADNTFDQAVVLDTLSEIREDVGALREIARVLKPGGKLIVSAASHYSCIATLFPEQRFLRRLIPRRFYRPYETGQKSWLEGDEESIKKSLRIQKNYTLEDLRQKTAPFFEVLRHTFVIKKYAALATDFTYGVKGVWFLRPPLFWLAVRLDATLQKKSEGYTVVVELQKKG